jgi:mannose-6-phosphate isomerase-like protein (cupin superfamily)
VDGRFLIDLEEEERTVRLAPKQGFAVPRGVVHRTRAPEQTVILMIEGAGVVLPATEPPNAVFARMIEEPIPEMFGATRPN